MAEQRSGYPHADLASLSVAGCAEVVGEREGEEGEERGGWEKGMREIAPRCPPRCSRETCSSSYDSGDQEVQAGVVPWIGVRGGEPPESPYSDDARRRGEGASVFCLSPTCIKGRINL